MFVCPVCIGCVKLKDFEKFFFEKSNLQLYITKIDSASKKEGESLSEKKNSTKEKSFCISMC